MQILCILDLYEPIHAVNAVLYDMPNHNHSATSRPVLAITPLIITHRLTTVYIYKLSSTGKGCLIYSLHPGID